MIKDEFVTIIRKNLRRNDTPPDDGAVRPGQSYSIDLPAGDVEKFYRENVVIQCLDIRLPLTHQFCQEIQAFQRKFGMDTKALADVIISLGVIQLKKLLDSPLVEHADFDDRG